jgi:DNA-binding transcriptional regulator YdaS (Cro superfamily)
MPLKQWKRQMRLRDPEIAQLMDVTTDTVKKWLGGRVPREEQVYKIYRVTKGRVTPTDLYVQIPKIRFREIDEAAE